MEPTLLNSQNAHYLLKGDELTIRHGAKIPYSLRDFRCNNLVVSRVTPEGDIELQENPGYAYPANLFDFVPPLLIGRNPEREKIKVGDTVVLIDLGWGIGRNEGRVLEPLEVTKINDGVSNYYGYRVHLKGYSKSVNPKALRRIKGEDDVTTQQNLAKSIMKHLEIERLGLECILAGGAPRNWEFGKAARDLDIYLLGAPLGLFTLENLLKNYEGPKGEKVKNLVTVGSAHHHYQDSHIKSVFSGKVGSQKVEFIVCTEDVHLKTPKDDLDFMQVGLLDSFNCNLCKIAMDSEGNIMRTREFKEDKANKELTYPFYSYMADYHRERSLEHHIPKMMKYFPEFTVVIQQTDPKENL